MKDPHRKLLTLSPYGSRDPTTGGTKRIHYLNRGYAEAGWEVLQISGASVKRWVNGRLWRTAAEITTGYSELVYFNPAVILGNRLLRELGTAQTAVSLLPAFMRTAPRIAAEIAKHRVILFEHPHYFDLATRHLRDDHLVVLDAHNIESRIYENLLDKPGLSGAAAGKLLEVERRCMARADLVFTCSTVDRDIAIRKFSVDPDRVHIASNGVDIASTPFIEDEERAAAKRRLGLEGPTALFVGSNWPPNVEAARHILSLAEKRPEITYLVVGAVGDPLPRERPANVLVAGMVEDLRPWLAAADLAINPMVSGSGSNIKMFEYCAAGLPTVSTHFGARGIDDVQGRAVQVCDLGEIPDCVAVLAGSQDIGIRRQAARDLASSKYDWSAIAAGIIRTIQAALEQRER
jgi:glycosyltransferase involved in cell wall biosynthesis